MVYASKFKQLACDISWGEATFINQFQFGLQVDVKDLLLTLPNPSTLNQAIAQVVWRDSRLFEHEQERRHEPTSTTQRNFPPTIPTQPSTTLPKDDPMQIDKTIFKPLTKKVKQC
jgi:hypothetical protein